MNRQQQALSVDEWVKWIVDTGATKTTFHSAHLAKYLCNKVEKPDLVVKGSSGAEMTVSAQGTLPLRSNTGHHISAAGALHVPDARENLFSVGAFLDAGDEQRYAIITRDELFLLEGHTLRVLARAQREGALYKMETKIVPLVDALTAEDFETDSPVQSGLAGKEKEGPGKFPQTDTTPVRVIPKRSLPDELQQALRDAFAERSRLRTDIVRLHMSLGHASLSLMRQLCLDAKHHQSRGEWDRLPRWFKEPARRELLKLTSLPCGSCAMAKLTKKPVPKQREHVEGDIAEYGAKPKEQIDSDIAGPFMATKAKKYRYFAVFVHRRTRYAWVYFLQSRADVFDVIRENKKLWETAINGGLDYFLSDNAKEYTADELRTWFRKQGVSQRFSCPDSSAQDGIAERYIRSLREMAHAMLQDSGLAKSFWAEAVLYANYIKNHTPHSNLHGLTPYEELTARPSRRDLLQPFGCQTMSQLPAALRTKFGDKARVCVFLGVSEEHKDGARLLHMDTGQIIVGRSLRSFPHVFPRNPDLTARMGGRLDARPGAQPAATENLDVRADDAGAAKPAQPGGAPAGVPLPVIRRQSTRQRAAPAKFEPTAWEAQRLHDSERAASYFAEVFGMPSDEERESPEMVQLALSLLAQGPGHYVREDAFALWSTAAEAVEAAEPATYRAARLRGDWPFWRTAIEEELAAQAKNQTWKVVKRPVSARTIKAKWVFKLKTDEEGNPVRYKARLVARGDLQRAHLDYAETFSPTARWPTIRMFLAAANAEQLEIAQMDVKTAFLIPTLPEEERILVDAPEHIKLPDGYVLELHKSMYGLKQAGRAWYQEADRALKKMGFIPTQADPCLYVKKRNEEVVCRMLLYVDDILIAGNRHEITVAKKQLSQVFDMTDEGEPRHFLGVKITRNREKKSISLDQAAYCEKLLKRFQHNDCNTAPTPAVESRLSKEMCPTSDEQAKDMADVPYREAIGALLYLSTATRPDIAYAVNQAAKFCENPGRGHWKAVKRIFCYLRGTTHHGVTFRATDHPKLVAYSDADDAGDMDTRRSVSGYVVMYGGGAVSWKSKQQSSTSLSSCESELKALTLAAQEVMWFRQLIGEIGAPSHGSEPTVIYEDNNGARDIAKNAKWSSRTKHIARRHFFVQEQVSERTVVVSRCNTENMLADIFTKPIGKVKFRELCEKIWNGEDSGN